MTDTPISKRPSRLGRAVWLGAVVVLASAVPAAPAMARQSNGGGPEVTRDGLKEKGYKCEYVATNFWECTKDGATTYWCDSHSCQPKPSRQAPPTRRQPPDARGGDNGMAHG